jgi:hypothetical protein
MERKTAKLPSASDLRILVGYALMIGGTVLLFWLIRGVGMGRAAPPLPAGQARFGAARAASSADALLHVLLALVVVIVVARALGSLFKHLQQPPVVGEIIAGILLGPSLLGRIAPHVANFLLPTTVAPFLGVLAQVGVILYAVLVPKSGDEPEPELQVILKEAARAAGKWLHTDVLAPRTPAQLATKTQAALVVIGSDLANELGLPLDQAPADTRCVVVVQGGAEEAARAAPSQPDHVTSSVS